MFKHIKSRILFLIIPILIFTSICSYFVSIKIGRDILEKEINDKMLSLDVIKKLEVEKIVSEVSIVSSTLSATVSKTYKITDFDNYGEILTSTMETNPSLDGVAIILSPYAVSDDINYSVAYAQRSSTGDIYSNTNYSQGTYKFYTKEFYTMAQNSDKLLFTEPKIDDLTRENIINSSFPIKDAEGNFIGCVATKIKLENVANRLKQYSIDNSRIYLLNEEGVFLVSANTNLDMNKFSINDLNNPSLDVRLFDEIYSKEDGMFKYKEDGVRLCYHILCLT